MEKTTREKLLEATRCILVQQGIENLTVENICSQAGFTRGAFYSNFGSKDQILEALALEEYQFMIDQLHQMVSRWQSNSDQHPQIARLLFEAMETIGWQNGHCEIHNELQGRSIRKPEWGMRMMKINDDFITELGNVLVTILSVVGRKPIYDIRTLAHSTLAIAIRAARIDVWRRAVADHYQADKTDESTGYTKNRPPQAAGDQIVASPARDIVEMIIVLLYASSERI